MSTDDATKVETIRQVIQAIMDNPTKVDWGDGLRLDYHAEDVPLRIGRADLMLIDKEKKTLYVVEIIPGEATAEDVGRLLGYLGWLKKNLLPGLAPTEELLGMAAWFKPSEFEFVQEIKGIVLAEGYSGAALCALAACPEMMGKTYRFSIELGQAN